MIDLLPNREILELCLYILFWGSITVIALLAVILYRITHITRSQGSIARKLTQLMGIVGE